MTGPAFAPKPKDWVQRAQNDLRNAEHTLTLVDDCPFDTVCFHAQQCAEKYLKALLLARGVRFPRTHDLIELVLLLPEADRSEVSKTGLRTLNPYVNEGRYPETEEPLDRSDAESAVAIARGVRDAVRALLPQDTF